MGNLRVIFNNAADRATLSASTTSGTLSASNMQKDTKSAIWRSLGTTETITALWTTAELIGGIALPFCNLTSQATIRIRGYTNISDVSAAFDTGVILACANVKLGMWNWGDEVLGVNAFPPNSLGVNNFAYGGGAYTCAWISRQTLVKKLVVNIVDTANTDGHLEISRIVTGGYWEPTDGAEQGATISMVDTSKQYRTDAGDQMTDSGTKHRKQTFSLPSLNNSDRAKMWSILRGNGLSKPIFISMYPENSDSRLEQTHQIYGKLVTTPIMGTPYFNHQSATVDIEEI